MSICGTLSCRTEGFRRGSQCNGGICSAKSRVGAKRTGKRGRVRLAIRSFCNAMICESGRLRRQKLHESVSMGGTGKFCLNTKKTPQQKGRLCGVFSDATGKASVIRIHRESRNGGDCRSNRRRCRLRGDCRNRICITIFQSIHVDACFVAFGKGSPDAKHRNRDRIVRVAGRAVCNGAGLFGGGRQIDDRSSVARTDFSAFVPVRQRVLGHPELT